MLFHAAAIEISVGPTRIAKRSQLGEHQSKQAGS
jgi:hypothetical protein